MDFIKRQRRWKVTYQHGVDGYRHELNLSNAVTVFLIALLISVFVLAFLFLYNLSNWNKTQKSLLKVQQENILLREKLDYYSDVIDTVYKKLDSLNILDSRVRSFDRYNPMFDNQKGPRILDDTFVYDSYLDARVNSLEQQLVEVTSALQLKNALANEFTALTMIDGIYSDGAPAIYPTFGRWSDGWGIRRHPFTNRLHFHFGVDIANLAGTPIYASADGEVVLTGYDPEYGKLIKIRHSNGYETRYGHLHSFKAAVGDKVYKGQIIALMGSTGMSTGPHLHYEVLKNGSKVNPTAYLNRQDTEVYYATQ